MSAPAEAATEPAAEPVRVGHSASGPSQPPRARGRRGGKHVRTGETIRAWQRDFDNFARWLHRETGGFSLRYTHHSEAHHELIWTVRTFRVLLNYCFTDQILVHFANIYTPYRNWSFSNGYTDLLKVLRDLGKLPIVPNYPTGSTSIPKFLVIQIPLEAFGATTPSTEALNQSLQVRSHPFL